MRDHTTTRLDPRSPLVFDTRQLPRQPGSMRTFVRVVPAPVELALHSVTEGVYVTGTVTGRATGECARCLRSVDRELAVPVQELFAYPDSATDATTDQDEVGRLQDDLIDLEPTVRDAVVLALPSSPLCRDDCPGLCPECGAHWDDLPADHRHERLVDPRWAALKSLVEE